MKTFCKITLFALLASVSLVIAGTVAKTGSSEPSSNVITLYTDVDDESADRIINEIFNLTVNLLHKEKPILLFINSKGGDVSAGLRILDAMRAAKRPIYTINVGTAASMAAYIFSYGDVRIMTPNSTLMFHNAQVQTRGDIFMVLNRLENIRRKLEGVQNIFCTEKNIDCQDFKMKMMAEYWLNPTEALENGFTDKVIDIPFTAPISNTQ